MVYTRSVSSPRLRTRISFGTASGGPSPSIAELHFETSAKGSLNAPDLRHLVSEYPLRGVSGRLAEAFLYGGVVSPSRLNSHLGQ
jgi:hypothetical protein